MESRDFGGAAHVAEPAPPMDPAQKDAPSWVDRFVVGMYFPLLVRFRGTVLLTWLVVFGVCAFFGPKFLDATRPSLDVPAGTPSAIAMDVFNTNYPTLSSWPPTIVLLQNLAPGGDVVSPESRAVYDRLVVFAAQHAAVSGILGFFGNNTDMQLVTNRTVSPDHQLAIVNVFYGHDAVLDDVLDVVRALKGWAPGQSSATLLVSITGIYALFQDMSDDSQASLFVIDMVVLPLAICVLGLSMRSYRHMAVAVAALACAILLAFAVMYGIAGVFDVNPFSPSIMTSLGIAVCFDYCLFLLARFREHRWVAHESKEESVLGALLGAGHVVILSGSTLFATFVLLFAFPQNFLNSVAFVCSAVVVTAMIVNLSLVPALLLYFDCLSVFEPIPCYFLVRERNRAAAASRGDPAVPAIPAIELASPAPTRQNSDLEVAMSTPSRQKTAAELGQQLSALELAGSAAPQHIGFFEARRKRSLWFAIPWLVTEYPFIVLAISAAITAPFLWQFVTIHPTSDQTLIYLQDSPSLNALQAMQTSFPRGQLDPYSVILTTGVPNAVISQQYFDVEYAMIQRLLSTQAGFMDTSSVTALSFWKGAPVAFSTAAQYLTPGSGLYNSSTAAVYRAVVAASALNAEKSASLVKINTLTDPNAQSIVPFIDHVRDILVALSAGTQGTSLPVGMFLFGAYTTTLDVQNALFELVPLDIGLTLLIIMTIVGVSFRSAMLTLRLALTVLMSLTWTFGLLVIVYQPGAAQDGLIHMQPKLRESTGIYWLIPVMSFSILVGLALDYDIFLISRLVEFREMGWSDRAAVCLAVEKTGLIITSAGVIMAVSFAGLLLPRAVVLNQYGFNLFIGVVLDTFVVRTIIVPAVIVALGGGSTGCGKPHFFDRVNWWPREVPSHATPAEELRALAAGKWAPPVMHVARTSSQRNAIKTMRTLDANAGAM